MKVIEVNESVQKIIVKRGDKSFISSCVFITPRIALTAAHSVVGEESVECLNCFASKVVVHKDYDQKKSNFLNDIAIVIFKENISSFAKISRGLIGDTFYRLGFGFRENENKRASFMIHFRESHLRYNKFYDLSSVIGDSGGGIFNNKNELVAIHSTKEGSSITYSVNLSYYTDWINSYREPSPPPWKEAI